jgi:dolichyl-phosphate beta-glucosyltransferase
LKKQPLWRRAGSRGFRWLIHTAMGIPHAIGDTQCGFKLYRLDVARELYAALTTPGYMFDIEIILRAVDRRYRIGHFPVRWSNDADSRFQPISGPISIARSLAGMRLRLLAERRRATSGTTASSRPV